MRPTRPFWVAAESTAPFIGRPVPSCWRNAGSWAAAPQEVPRRHQDFTYWQSGSFMPLDPCGREVGTTKTICSRVAIVAALNSPNNTRQGRLRFQRSALGSITFPRRGQRISRSIQFVNAFRAVAWRLFDLSVSTRKHLRSMSNSLPRLRLVPRFDPRSEIANPGSGPDEVPRQLHHSVRV